MGGNLKIVCRDQIPHRYQFWPGCGTHKQGRHWVTDGTRLNYDSSGKAGMALTPPLSHSLYFHFFFTIVRIVDDMGLLSKQNVWHTGRQCRRHNVLLLSLCQRLWPTFCSSYTVQCSTVQYCAILLEWEEEKTILQTALCFLGRQCICDIWTAEIDS